VALLPQEKPKQIALVVGLIALAGLYGFYEYWYSPRAAEVETVSARLVQLQDRNRQAQVAAARGGVDLEERLSIYERHVARLEELIPQSEEVSALLSSVATEARLAGVEVVVLNPGPSQPEAFYTRQTYEMAVIGDYHPVARFLTAVASLPRIITPVDMEIQPFDGSILRDDMEAPITARFRIETYVLPSSAPIEGPPMQGGV
jgi:type IV pilus assembly protein PilO